MSQYATADEEVAQLKTILKEYGPAVVLGLVIALGGTFGYKAWQGNQEQIRENASALYSQVLELNLAQQPGQALSDAQQGSLLAVTEKLKSDYADSSYAGYAVLFSAKQAIAEGELAMAEAELNWVITQQKQSDIADLARIRLARVLMAQDEPRLDDAQALLEQAGGANFQLSAQAALGDLFSARGDVEAAREQYQRALDLAREQGSALPLVQLKLDDLAIASDEA